MNDEERDQLLIRLDERTHTIVKHLMPSVSKRLAEHIKYHWIVSVPVGIALLGLLIKIIIK